MFNKQFNSMGEQKGDIKWWIKRREIIRIAHWYAQNSIAPKRNCSCTNVRHKWATENYFIELQCVSCVCVREVFISSFFFFFYFHLFFCSTPLCTLDCINIQPLIKLCNFYGTVWCIIRRLLSVRTIGDIVLHFNFMK